ncbi:TIGR03089 family protein [Streptacidiphilus jiangxiensis]|uniref:TIGR03089 family protein n=1 Tax=Streptacidiphilus jiangxiensis TaxID=235985 RepID=A0A1H7YRB8_STRJI|nr:TIGR03089 family protein [Streptacidiphilus jiangxiensis]SEM48816.1 TIGR03089 family protein [Streptacidiphilus jiangxiensis]
MSQTPLSGAESPADLLRSLLEADPARPLITFYDDATGERVELSVKTFDNWVAKTANLLQDELLAAPDDRCALLLPAHWQSAIWLFACWSVGVLACPGGDPAKAQLVVSGPDSLEEALDCDGERVALALRPLGGRFPQLPDGFVDYAVEVPAQGDRFVPYAPVDPARPALEIDGEQLSGSHVVALAAEHARQLGLGEEDRVLSTLSYGDWDGLAGGLLAPLVVGGSVVLCRHSESLAPETLARRIADERVTRQLD